MRVKEYHLNNSGSNRKITICELSPFRKKIIISKRWFSNSGNRIVLYFNNSEIPSFSIENIWEPESKELIQSKIDVELEGNSNFTSIIVVTEFY